MVFITILIVLILINAYFSAAEIALVSVKKIKVQQQAAAGSKAAQTLLKVLEDPDQFLSAIQVGVTLVSVIEGLYGGELLAAYLQPILLGWGLKVWLAHFGALVISISTITYITIILGELLPKTLALQYPQGTALKIVGSFKVFTFIAFPFVKLLTSSTHFLLRILSIKGSENQKLTEADLRSFLSLAFRQGAIPREKWLLHDNIFSFYDLTVEKIMTPIDKVISLSENAISTEIVNILRDNKHQIFPVLDGNNSIVGCLIAKDYFMELPKKLSDSMIDVPSVDSSCTAAELLKLFKKTNMNFAAVTNEKMGMIGIVTMHDIGEALIGKIP